MSDNHGLTKSQIVFLSAVTSTLMATAVFVGTAPPSFGVPDWIVWLFGSMSIIVVIFRDAYGLRSYSTAKSAAEGK